MVNNLFVSKYVKALRQVKIQHKDMKFQNWGLTTIWHNIQSVKCNIFFFKITPPYSIVCRAQNQDLYRRKGKFCRCCQEDRIYSIPCLALPYLNILYLDDDLDQVELYQDNLKEKDEFILFFKIILGKIASTAMNSPKLQRRPLPFLLYLSFFCGTNISFHL